MQHTKCPGHQIIGSGDDYFKGFYLKGAWWHYWLYALNGLNIFSSTPGGSISLEGWLDGAR